MTPLSNRSPLALLLLLAFGSSVMAPLWAQSPKPTQSPKQAATPAKKYSLRYKFALGDIIRYEVDHRASVRTTIEKITQSAVTRSESLKVWKIIDVMPNGEIELVHQVDSVRMTNKLPDRAEMVYDSRKDRTPPPGFEDAARAIGVPLSVIRMSPHGEVIERKVKHHQPAADAEAPVALLLPKEPVAIGSVWNEPRVVPIKTQDGAIRDIQCRRHYKLTKVKDNVATIEVSYQVLSPIDPYIESQLVQRLMKGTAKFDLVRGRIVSQQMDVDERILGFAGPASTMHHLMRMKEKMIEPTAEVASRP